jgi:6-phosphogluconolactonase
MYPSGMEPRLVVTRDVDELVSAALVRDEARQVVAARGLFRVVLSGGETPRALYTRLADDLMYRDLPWDRTLVFWGDERHIGAVQPVP